MEFSDSYLHLKFVVREASHIDYVHEKRHMFVSLETPPPYEVIFKEHFLLLFDRSSRQLNSSKAAHTIRWMSVDCGLDA